MEHHLLQPQHLTPHDRLMASPGFFHLCGSSAHFPCGGGCGFVAPVGLNNDCGWAGDLMQLGGGTYNTTVGAVADDHQARPCDGGPLDGPPPPCLPLDGDGDATGYPPKEKQHGVRELTSEPHRDDGNVSGTRKRRDRAKTIVLERKRRVRMQEKLYELRSLVPNITKMDKASIIADAVAYVKNLQSHARKLKEEVAVLEAPPRSSPNHDRGAAAKRLQDDAFGRSSSGGSHGARVAHVGAARVGEGRFLVTVECERRDGAAAHLCTAVESLACFRVESSSLGRSAPDRVVSTVTLKATCQAEAATIGEGTVKLLMMAALGEEGFRIEATAGIS